MLVKNDEHSSWTKCFASVVQVQMKLCKDQKTSHHFIRLSVTKDSTAEGLDITLPMTRLKKTSACFLQWRDKKYNSAWGLNFVSEKDVERFLKIVSLPSKETKRRSRHNSESSNTTDPHALSSSRTSLNSSGEFLPPPTITISKETPTPKSEEKPVVRKPIVPPRRNLKSNNLNLEETSSRTSEVLAPKKDDVPTGFDPTEYEYLMNEKENADEEEDDDENVRSNSRSASFSSLVNSKNLDDSLSGLSEDFQDTRPPSVVNLNRKIMSTRKAAWLLVKNVLVHSKKGRLELSSNRKWRKYWVALKGIVLSFFDANEKTASTEDMEEPSYELDVDACLVQAVPEYTRLENVFSLCTKDGNAYYLQATSQAEVENWIHCIHTSAAGALARKRGKENITSLLYEENNLLQEKMNRDEKLLKMAILQLKIEKESHVKQNILDQVISWEQSLELLHSNIYRLNCYLAAVESMPVPNPQDLLSHVSRQTKQALSKIGLFSVTSFQSYVNTKNTMELPPESKRKYRGKNSSGGIKARLLNSLKIADDNVVSAIRSRHSAQNKKKTIEHSTDEKHFSSKASKRGSDHSDKLEGRVGDSLYINLPNSKSCCLPFEQNLRISDLMERICMKENLDSTDYFLILMIDGNNKHGLLDYNIPKESAMLDMFQYSRVKLCPKLVYEVTLSNPADYEHGPFGLDLMQMKDERIEVTFVEDGSPAWKSGIIVNDEVIEINKKNLREVNNSFNDILEVINVSSSISLKLRSKRIDDPKKTFQTTESMISFLVCPPPPKTLQPDLSDDLLNTLIVPAPADLDDDSKSAFSSRSFDQSTVSEEAKEEDIDMFLQKTEQVNMMTREMNAIPIGPGVPNPSGKKPGVNLRKAVIELQETEKTYVKNLKILLERYLIPLKEENFLSKDEAELLVNNVREMYSFQSMFLDRLKEIIQTEIGFEDFIEVEQCQNIVYLIGESFLEYVDKFKLYSTFCSCHSRAVKLLELNTNDALRAFLIARNPKQQHTGTLESYLIIPIQRILRYPLLMKTMLKYMQKESDEYKCLYRALKKVEEVADYINEMQRISETFTPIFQDLCLDHETVEKTDMGVDNLLHYGRVHWLNHDNSNSRGSGFTTVSFNNNNEIENLTVFIFKKALVLISYNTKMKKKLSSSHNIKSDSFKNKSSDIKFFSLIPIASVLLRDHAWSENDSDQLWEVVDVTSDIEDEQIPYVFVNRTSEEKKVFVNAIKEAKKLNKISSSVPALGQKHNSLQRNTKDEKNNNPKKATTKLEPGKPNIKKKPSFSKSKDGSQRTIGLPSPRLPRMHRKSGKAS